MRPIVKSSRFNGDGSPLEINPYGDAKSDLVIEIGSFCSFCEKYNCRSALHVEHIFGKKCANAAGVLIYDHLKSRWDNFLLACVNCNGVKGVKDIGSIDLYMPHRDNILHYIEISNGALIKIKDGLDAASISKAQAFIDLVGLDRVPGSLNFSEKDDRWEERLKTYDIAKRYYEKYTENPSKTDVETIVNLSRKYGFFSVWYYQFLGHKEVIDTLINGIQPNDFPFPSTHAGSFDATDGYTTLER